MPQEDDPQAQVAVRHAAAGALGRQGGGAPTRACVRVGAGGGMGGGAIGNGADSIAVMRQLQRELKKRRDSKGEVGEDEEVVGWGRAGLCLYIRTYIHTYMHACMHACMHT